jgi:myosin heavy subunit
VFKSVQQDMLDEHIDEKYLKLFSYSDNGRLLSKLETPPLGLFDILQDSCSLANDDDESFINKLAKIYTKDDSLSFSRKNKLELTINHTAGPVTYNVNGFRVRNMDIRRV